MLLSLHIENIAIIEKTDIDFSCGFNVLTGETGAGKSIIIDSINFLLGNKSAKNLIRSGQDYAFVSAVFTEFNDYQKNILKNNDIFPDDDGNIIISRKISADGRSYSKINGCAVSVANLKNISGVFINIHGQHDGSKILNSASHIDFLDEYCCDYKLIEEYRSQYEYVKNVRNHITKLSEIKDSKQQLEETLIYKINEIEQCNLKVGELEKLKSLSVVANNGAKILNSLQNCDNLLSNEERGVSDSVASLISEFEILGNFFDDSNALVEIIKNIKAELDDVSEYINKKLDEYEDFNLSPDFIEGRIYQIEKILSKYSDEQNALNKLKEYKEQLNKLEDNEYELEQAYAEYKTAILKLEQKATKLSEIRQKYAKKLSGEISVQLKELDMPNVKFSVDVSRNVNSRGGNKYTQIGFDCVEFLISPNAGQDLKPLSKIASGGELSRIMLCLKTVLSGDNEECNTIIFDEVDSGVSGSTAQKIGIKLKKAAKDKQVFSITHLAQIAALADYHYKVEKNTDSEVTTSKIKLLDENERVGEVARIMGGVEITPQIIESAKELINNSKIY